MSEIERHLDDLRHQIQDLEHRLDTMSFDSMTRRQQIWEAIRGIQSTLGLEVDGGAHWRAVREWIKQRDAEPERPNITVDVFHHTTLVSYDGKTWSLPSNNPGGVIAGNVTVTRHDKQQEGTQP